MTCDALEERHATASKTEQQTFNPHLAAVTNRQSASHMMVPQHFINFKSPQQLKLRSSKIAILLVRNDGSRVAQHLRS